MSVSVDTKAGVPQVLAGRLHDPAYRGFASDNYAGAHAEIIEAVQAANEGHVTAYGEDVYTAALQVLIKSHFGAAATAYPVFNGTGANVLALQALLPRWGAVICAATAHINTDENGAPERIGGIKLLPVPTPDGKLTPELIDAEAWGGETSTGRNRWSYRSPRPPNWAPATRRKKSNGSLNTSMRRE